MSDVDGHLRAWLPMTPLSPRTPILDMLSESAGRWLRASGRSVRRWLDRGGFARPDLLWVDSVIWDGLPRLLRPRRSVLRIADLGSGFPRHRRTFDEMERRLATAADLVVYTHPGLRDHVNALNPKASREMQNGVFLERFTETAPEPADLARIGGPRVLYVGAIDEWFDFTLVDRLARALPDVAFVIVGPDQLARARLPERPNIHLLGARRPEEVPGYMQHASVGLIPFDVAAYPDLVSAIQPLKLFEYLASGLPVVATRWRELERLGSPAVLSDNAGGAEQAIREAIERRPSPAAGLEWVRAADWSARLDPVLRSLGLPGVLGSAE